MTTLRHTAITCIVIAVSLISTAWPALNPPVQDWFPAAPPLAYAQGPTVEVSDPAGLVEALGQAEPGQTILLADGLYEMPMYVEIRADNVTLRSASGHRERVIIDGSKSNHGELIGVRNCSGVTIADLTIQNVKWNGFKINSETNVQDLTIYNCIIHNVWQRGVKGVKVPPENREAIRPKRCRVQYCLFYNDRPKRLSDDETDIAHGNYIAGIDVMYAQDWVISNNVFVGIQGRTGEGRGAIFLWFDTQDCVIERNIIIDCDIGLQLGNPHRADGVETHCTGCVARNNFITRAPEAGIVTAYTRNCRILNNTIHDPQSRLGRLIRTVTDNDGLVIANNLISGPRISNESTSDITFANNVIEDMTAVFTDPDHGNLHLTESASIAVDRADALADVTNDIDGQIRDGTPDIGADEWTRGRERTEIHVANTAEFRQEIEGLAAGTTIILAPGIYRGGVYLSDLHGTAKSRIVIQGADANDPPVFAEGTQAFHLADCSYVTLRNLKATGFPTNGINIDDGGAYETPAHHILIENVTIIDTGPTGNHDALKLSGLDWFTVRHCRFEGWGGSGIDMVGCHHGLIENCTFVGKDGFSQSNAVQLKGGTEDVLVQRSLFKHTGHRSINLGGSTGLPFFRPSVGNYEARNITIAGNRFVGSAAPMAWVTADGGHVHHNTVVLPETWVLRILQETEDSQFKPSHDGVFERNIVVYDSGVRTFVNVGPRTAPETFQFRRNAWLDLNGRGRPTLPTAEEGGVYLDDVDLDESALAEGIITLEGDMLEDMGAAAY